MNESFVSPEVPFVSPGVPFVSPEVARRCCVLKDEEGNVVALAAPEAMLRALTADLFAQRKEWERSDAMQKRWPYGPTGFHEPCCQLQEGPGECDCKASDESDELWGAC